MKMTVWEQPSVISHLAFQGCIKEHMFKAFRKGLMTVQKAMDIALNNNHSLTVRKMGSYQQMVSRLIHKVYYLTN